MTEEIIKECKNCDALGIDSEIGVYYCCLSHRQDDLPKEFTCNDFTPNKQLKRLEIEIEKLKGIDGSVHPDSAYYKITRLEQERDELKQKYEDAASENLNEIYELIKKNDAWRGIVSVMNERLEKQIDELKTELHSKVEFIQEQRTIINDYAKEIKMYEQCQGKRASKREKELENDLDNLLIKYAGCKTANTAIQEENKKLISALEEIRDIEQTPHFSRGVQEGPLAEQDFLLGAVNKYEQRRIKILNKTNEVLQ